MDVEEIEKLREECCRYELSGRELFGRYNADSIRFVCNGIGPSWMPEILRDFVSTMNPSLEPVAAIHDMRYDIGGTEEDFLAANAEFEENGVRIAKAKFGWWRPRRYLVIAQAKKFRALCDKFGKPAFRFEAKCGGAG